MHRICNLKKNCIRDKVASLFFLGVLLLTLTNCDWNLFKKKDSNTLLSNEDLGIKETDPLLLDIREQNNDQEREQKRATVIEYFNQNPTLDEKTKQEMYNSVFWHKIGATQNDITQAKITKNVLSSKFQVEICFNAHGNKIMKDISKRNLGKNLGIFLDNKLIASPIVNEVITEESIFITGTQTEEQANILVAKINKSIKKNKTD
jgi:preprotein translocase subunit SecD